MATNSFSLLIILLVSIVIGMIIGLLTRSKDKYHGPRASKVREQIFYDPRAKQCVQFDVKPVVCPKK